MRKRHIEETISSQRHARNQIVLLKQDIERVFIASRNFAANFLSIMRHLEGIEKSLETIVDVATHEYPARFLPPQKQHIKAASQMPLFFRKRQETKAIYASICIPLDAELKGSISGVSLA